jgi:hypothetical protein
MDYESYSQSSCQPALYVNVSTDQQAGELSEDAIFPSKLGKSLSIKGLIYDHVPTSSPPLILPHIKATESDRVCRQGSSLALRG